METKPKNTEELVTVSVVGQHKLAHYGSHFLKALQEYK
jgi:ATP-dependent DNA helicase RecQ